MSGIFLKMSGILDPRILPSRSSVYVMIGLIKLYEISLMSVKTFLVRSEDFQRNPINYGYDKYLSRYGVTRLFADYQLHGLSKCIGGRNI